MITKTTEKRGLAGAISGVSEETAGLLAGQMQAMMMNTAQIRDMTRNDIIRHLQAISNKTGDLVYLKYDYAFGGRLTHINDRLIETRNHVETMKDYTSVIMQTALDNLRANQETAINSRYLKYLRSIDEAIGGTVPSNLRALGV